MQSFDVVAVGDAILDVFIGVKNQDEFCQWDDKGHLMLHAGAKILVDETAFMLGGNACNVSVGLKRLGIFSSLIAEFGSDEFAEKLKNGLEKEAVDLSLSQTTPDAPSTFSVGIQVGNDRTLFIHHVKREHNFSWDFETKWLYLTSLGEKWEHVYKAAAVYKKATNTKLAFNPGSLQMKTGVESFKNVLEVTDILIINRDEAEMILHGKALVAEEKETEENMLFRIQRMGPKMIVMTDGDNGSYVMDENAKLFYEKGVKVAVIGKTGAGDGYTSGFLAAIIAEKTVQEAMQWGAVNAMGVIGHIGAQTGLLERKVMEEKVAEHFLKVKQI